MFYCSRLYTVIDLVQLARQALSPLSFLSVIGMKKRTAAVILVSALLAAMQFGCVTAFAAGPGIRLSELRRIDVRIGFVGVATVQHYYAISLNGDVARPITIEQLD